MPETVNMSLILCQHASQLYLIEEFGYLMGIV